MRYWAAYVLLCSAILFVRADPGEAEPASPDSHAQLAYKYLLARIPEKDREYYRFLSYYNYEKLEPVLQKRVKTLRFWVNQLHFETSTSFAEPVPGSGGLLFAIDIRDYGWSRAAFSAVARREPYFREPAVDAATAILLRKMAYIDQDPKSLHVEMVVRADWFFRETMESDRSTSYYDLLFSKQRFTKSYAGAGKWVRKVQKFPANEADFEKIFGIDKFREHFKEFKIDTRHGAVVEGGENGGSVVARQNRLIERTRGPIGSYYKTFDVKETSGKRDFAETLNKDFEFDAGEILADLPAGGMAALLVDAKGNIVEVADNRFAIDSSDLKLDARVRTPGSCFVCHEQKYITPKNLVEEMGKAGIDIRFKDKRAAIAAKGFFLNWIDKMEGEQTRFEKFIARTSGFKAGENALNLKAWRDEYDAPVDLITAIREIGVPADEFKLAAVKSTKARILLLMTGKKIPRKTWEVDGYREMVLQINARKK